MEINWWIVFGAIVLGVALVYDMAPRAFKEEMGHNISHFFAGMACKIPTKW
jgi:hypothetical protein